MILPKLVLTDIDGVWTDGGMYYDKSDNEWKKFNTSDSAGVLFLKLLDIPVGIITGENTPIVKRRAEKLNIDILHLGIKNKVQVIDEILSEMELNWSDLAYIGDDINDILTLKKAGFSAAPSSAPSYVKKDVDFVTNSAGGEGAFREFVEHILEQNQLMDKALNLYFEKLNLSQ